MYRFVDRDMLLRHHWGLGVGHIYSHVASSSDENHTFTETGNRSVAEATSPSSSMPISPKSRSQNNVGGSTATIPVDDHDPDEEFVLPHWGGSELEWEVARDSESDSSSSESEGDAEIHTMYALYDGDDSDY